MKLVMLITMYINETYSKVCRGKNLSDAFPIQDGMKHGNALLPWFYNFALDILSRRFKKIRKEWK
jgi:hypothetical protein